jgi:hypothetical protein
VQIGADEHSASRSAPAPEAAGLRVLGASYGLADVTSVVQSKIGFEQNLHFTADNATFGDSWPINRKACVVVSSTPGGSPATLILVEGQSV